jgi:hypothetical protein
MLLHRNNMGGIPDLCMHAFWHIGAEANMVALREPFPIHLDTRTDVVTMHRDANRWDWIWNRAEGCPCH